MTEHTEPTKEELQREVEAQALADRVWEILEKRVHAQLEGVIALEPRVLHPHIDLWFAHRTGHHPDKVAGNALTELIADSLSGNYRMQQWFKQMHKQQVQEIVQRMHF